MHSSPPSSSKCDSPAHLASPNKRHGSTIFDVLASENPPAWFITRAVISLRHVDAQPREPVNVGLAGANTGFLFARPVKYISADAMHGCRISSRELARDHDGRADPLFATSHLREAPEWRTPPRQRNGRTRATALAPLRTWPAAFVDCAISSWSSLSFRGSD
jgi:hypothetical protein